MDSELRPSYHLEQLLEGSIPSFMNTENKREQSIANNLVEACSCLFNIKSNAWRLVKMWSCKYQEEQWKHQLSEPSLPSFHAYRIQLILLQQLHLKSEKKSFMHVHERRGWCERRWSLTYLNWYKSCWNNSIQKETKNWSELRV